MFKVTVFSSRRYERDFLHNNPQLLNLHPDLHFIFLVHPLSSSTAYMAAGSHAVCAFVNDQVDEKTIAILSKNSIQCILLRCAGYNQVDLSAAAAHSIRVLTVPAYSPYAVAEFAVALLLTVARKTHKAYNRTRESNFALAGLMGMDIHGKTVGICGTGKIGTLFAKILLSFGANVIGNDIYPSEEVREMGVEYVSMDELLERSDIISLHCPLLNSTRHMIGKEAVAKMKKGVILVNTSRGELVDMCALIDGLKRKVIGACAMDVVEGEGDLFHDDHSGEILEDDKIAALQAFPNVLITPHVAFCTETAMGNIWESTVENAEEFWKRGGEEGVLTNEIVHS